MATKSKKATINARIQKEKELVRRTLNGDTDAFNTLYLQHYHRILATLVRRTRNQQDAEDLAQLTFLRAYQDLATYRGEAAFSTWLMQIAINLFITHIRATRARKSWHDTIKDPQLGYRDIWEPASVEHPDDVLNHKEYQEILEESISTLPQQYRSAVRMRYVQDRSYADIANELSVPMGTLKTWLHRARHQLQETLNETELATM